MKKAETNVVSFMRVNHKKEVLDFNNKISQSKDCVSAFKAIWDIKTIPKHERVYALFLNRKSEVIATELINIGGYQDCIIEIRTIIEFVFNYNASSVVIAHNHPSGAPKPSDGDISETKRIKSILNELKIGLVDHLIITDSEAYYSFTDNKMLN